VFLEFCFKPGGDFAGGIQFVKVQPFSAGDSPDDLDGPQRARNEA